MLLTVIDLYYQYPECFILCEGTTAEIIILLCSVFVSHGFLDHVISNNGTPFVSQEFTKFLKNCGVTAVHLSLY